MCALLGDAEYGISRPLSDPTNEENSMSIDHALVSYTDRPDGRVDVRYYCEPILVAGEPPASEFR